MNTRRRILLAGLCLATTAAVADEPPDVVRQPPAYGEFLVIPVRLYILQSETDDDLNCRLTDDDLHRILRKVNRIWNVAGIHFGLDAICRGPAAHEEQFRLARRLDPDGRPPLGLYRVLIPDQARDFPGLSVVFLHKFPVNGVYLGDGLAIVQDAARLREVEGGIDEPIPRVTAHELGHALGLPHRQDRTNLLASGTTGQWLNTREVEQARKTARTLRGTRTVNEWRAKAEAAIGDNLALARRLWTWLAEIPGDGAPEARARLAALDDLDHPRD